MIQNFEPKQLERNFEPIEWNHESYEELNHIPGRPDHANDAACFTPNPPWWCDEGAMPVPIDNYIVVLLIIALIIAVIYLRRKNRCYGILHK